MIDNSDTIDEIMSDINVDIFDSSHQVTQNHRLKHRVNFFE
jgi:hypothetical protein